MSRRRDHDYAGGQSPGARAPSQRQLRVGEELRHTLAQLLRPGELRDPALREANITVTEVRVSPDLKNATAYRHAARRRQCRRDHGRPASAARRF